MTRKQMARPIIARHPDDTFYLGSDDELHRWTWTDVLWTVVLAVVVFSAFAAIAFFASVAS